MPLNIANIYDSHADSLYAFLLNYTRHEADAADILQDVFIKLASAPHLLDGITSPRSFLLKMCYRRAIDVGRKKSSYFKTINAASLDAPLFYHAEFSDDTEFANSIAAALADLPYEQRAVIHLKIWEEMTFSQIAEALDISAHTAASRYRYGIDKLQPVLRPLYQELRS